MNIKNLYILCVWAVYRFKWQKKEIGVKQSYLFQLSIIVLAKLTISLGKELVIAEKYLTT